MVRRLELNDGNLILNEEEIEGFLERTVTPIGTSGKADVPRRNQEVTGNDCLLIHSP